VFVVLDGLDRRRWSGRRRIGAHRLCRRNALDRTELGHRRLAQGVGIAGDALQRLNGREHALALDRDVGLEAAGVGAQVLAERLERADLRAEPLAQVLGALARVALGVRDHLGGLGLGLADLRGRLGIRPLARALVVGLGVASLARRLTLGVGLGGRGLALGFGEQRRGAGLGFAHCGVGGALGEDERAPQRLVGVTGLAGTGLGLLGPIERVL